MGSSLDMEVDDRSIDVGNPYWLELYIGFREGSWSWIVEVAEDEAC